MERTKFLFLDIETIPPNTLEEFTIEKSPPRNIKDPAKIEAWYIENKEKLFRAQSLDTNSAKILTLSAAFDEADPVCFCDKGDYSEEKVMGMFEEYFFDNIEERRDIDGRISDVNYDPMFVGVNSKAFDLQIMYIRSLKYDLKFLAPFLEKARQRYSKSSIDLSTIWAGSLPMNEAYVSMNKMMNVLGIPDTLSEGFDGSQVYDAFVNGEIDKIIQYNKDDVIRTRLIFDKIRNSIGY